MATLIAALAVIGAFALGAVVCAGLWCLYCIIWVVFFWGHR